MCDNIKHRDFNFYSSINFSELEKLGVEQPQINELKSIISDNKENPAVLKYSALKWLARVSFSMAALRSYDNLPAITEFIAHIMK